MSTSQAAHEVIDFTQQEPNGNPHDFSAWLKSGKIYKDVPDFVSDELLRRLSLSAKLKSLLPSPTLTISKLLEAELPIISSAAVFKAPQSCFSDINVRYTDEFLLKREVPSPDFLRRLRAAAGQAMLDGKVSIADWKYKDIYLPFEILSFWDYLRHASVSKTAWLEAKHWYSTGPRTRSLPTQFIPRITMIFDTVPWHGSLPELGQHVTITEMADLFSRKELSGSHIDTFLERLKVRLREDQLANNRDDVLVACLSFTDFLSNWFSNNKDYDPENVTTAEAKVVARHLEENRDDATILTVAHSPPNHWAALRIQFSPTKAVVQWGDSIGRHRPKPLMKGAKSFVSYYLQSNTIQISSDLKCAVQTDNYSCPIIAVNTLKHALFKTPLWTAQTADELRIQEFLDVMEFAYRDILENRAIDDLMEVNDDDTTAVELDIVSSSESLDDSESESDNGSDVEDDISRSNQKPIHSFFAPRKRPLTDEHLPPAKRPRLDTGQCKKPQAKPRQRPQQNGTSRAAKMTRKLNEQVENGTFIINWKRWNRWVEKLQAVDPHVEVNTKEPKKAREVRHSRCGENLIMKSVYNVSVFKEHVQKRCKLSSNPAANTQTLDAMQIGIPTRHSSNSSVKKSSQAPKMYPCPGLTKNDDPRITQYLKRARVMSAGGVSEVTIAKSMFDETYSKLPKNEQRIVSLQQAQGHTWRLERNFGRVVSVKCLLQVSSKDENNEVAPCACCKELLRSRNFLSAINRKSGNPKNRIYIPNKYQSQEIADIFAANKGLPGFLDDAESDGGDNMDVLLKFARQFAAGNFDDQPIFLDLVKVMTIQAERESKGTGMQNMKYPPAFDEWCHELQCTQPAAYRTFVRTFGGRSERSFKKIRSSKPAFQQGIGPMTLERALKYRADYNYPEDAPFSFGVDDSDLHAKLGPYFDGEKEKWFLVGSASMEPMEVADVASIESQIASAVETRAKKTKSPELADMEISLLKLLLSPEAKLHIVSLASDGTTVERDARRELVRKGFALTIHHRIPHPDTSQPPILVELLKAGTQVMTVIQDTKHTRKTARNGMYSGARLYVLGRYTVFYEQVRSLAFRDDSPLYIRDVEKLDRQDDRAAARLFSAQNLEHVIENRSEELGLIVYLFVFGELVDAYQSRTLRHIDRVKMVLRGRFFKEMWKSFLLDSEYPLAQHFLSKEADDITDIVVNGLLALIVIHRDHLDAAFPLLPWDHGTEVNEHIFGYFRQIIPDFTMLDVLHMVPKIGVKLMAACKRNVNADDLKKAAAGYSHTYFDGTDVNLRYLSDFPTDSEIATAASAAYDEALSLWILLGYDVASPSALQLEDPTPDAAAEAAEGEIEAEDDTGDDEAICCTEEIEDKVTESDDLHESLIAAAKITKEGSILDKTENALDEAGFAAAALNLHQLSTIQALPDEDPTALEEIRGLLQQSLVAIASTGPEARQLVQNLINSARQPTDVDDELRESTQSSNQLDALSETDLKELFSIRSKNQCREGAEAVRTRKSGRADEGERKKKPLSDRQLLAKKIQEITHLAETERGTSTGLNRKVRWTKASAGSAVSETSKKATGNVGNAQVAARAGANEVIKRRKKEFSNISSQFREELGTAKVDLISPLKKGNYGIIARHGELMIAKVLTMYERGGGKAAKHAWVSEANSIGSISYMPVQVWKQTRPTHRHFRAHWHPKLKPHGLPRFEHLPANAFLYLIPDACVLDKSESLDLVPAFFETVFTKLLAQDKPILAAVGRLLKRQRKSKATGQENGDVE